MIEKKDHPLLISAEEVAEICGKAGTTESIDRALNIIAACKKCAVPSNAFGLTWERLCLIASIYDGGRIQGIREERARQQAKCKE